MKRCILSVMLVLLSQWVSAQTWEDISDPEGSYYWGIGTAEDIDTANKVAIENLMQQIAVYVSSSYDYRYDAVNVNGNIDSKEVIKNVVNTYSSSALTNVQTWPFTGKDKKTGLVTVRKYMPKSELEKLYRQRESRIKDMIEIAESNLANKKVDVALQYYYWAYSLTRSLQFPAEFKDDAGNILIDFLPNLIRDIIRDIDVRFVGTEDDYVDLQFTYQGSPISVDFTYNDGNRDDVSGKAEGGNASLDMAPGQTANDSYHLMIEYQYRLLARADNEVNSVLEALPSAQIGEQKVVSRRQSTSTSPLSVQPASPSSLSEQPTSNTAGVSFTQPTPEPTSQSAESVVAPTCEIAVDKTDMYVRQMQTILSALRSHRYEQAYPCFVGRGSDNYRRMVCERKGRLVGEDKFTLYTAPNGRVMARGLQMAFSVTEKGRKTTLVDDMIFTFNAEGKIENLTFGIGTQSENDLLGKEVQWGEDVRQAVLDFLENYKTAYCLKDSLFLKAVFSDDAVIIIGHVAKPAPNHTKDNPQLNLPRVTYRQYSKAQYIQNLEKSFRRNAFVNIKFTNNDVQIDEELFPEKKIFYIRIGQEYSSSTYSDIGYLFLRVDITNPAEPIITFRSWQPFETPLDQVFTRGNFNL